jgi:imidazolonepropionase-like amidohydrolase
MIRQTGVREIFAAAEMQRAGLILAPRIFSTGEIIYGAKSAGVFAEVGNFDDALAHVRRLKAQGAYSVKNYNQPRREQRQMVVAAAQAENMLVVPEGGSLFNMDMSLIQDGNATVEHNVPGSTFYSDVLQFWSQTKTNYTPTLVVAYGGPGADPYWRARTNVWEHPLLRAHSARILAAGQRSPADRAGGRLCRHLGGARGEEASRPWDPGEHRRTRTTGRRCRPLGDVEFRQGRLDPACRRFRRQPSCRREPSAWTGTSAPSKRASLPTWSCLTPTRWRTSATPTRSSGDAWRAAL